MENEDARFNALSPKDQQHEINVARQQRALAPRDAPIMQRFFRWTPRWPLGKLKCDVGIVKHADDGLSYIEVITKDTLQWPPTIPISSS